MLGSVKEHERLAAVNGLGSLPLEELAPYADTVAERLGDEDPAVRAAAADVVGALGDNGRKHADRLAAMLVEAHSTLRQAAARALGRLRVEEKASALAEVLEDCDHYVSKEAALALGALGPAAASASAADRLRCSAVSSRKAAQRALIAMIRMRSGSPNTTDDADHGLEVLRAHVTPILNDELAEARAAAAEVLEKLNRESGGASIPASVAVAMLEDPSEETRLGAVRALGALGAQAAPHASVLAGRLADEAEAVRLAAVEALERLGEEHGAGAAPLAAGLLWHPLQTVRRAASLSLELLGEAGVPHSVDRHTALLADSSPQVRCQAVEALGKVGAAGQLEEEQVAFIAALHIDPHWCVRMAVATALHRCGKEALQQHKAALGVLLLDDDWRVRRAANFASASPKAEDVAEAGVE